MQVAMPSLIAYSFALRQLPDEAAGSADRYLKGLWSACGEAPLSMTEPMSKDDDPDKVGTLVTSAQKNESKEELGYERINGRKRHVDDPLDDPSVYQAFLFTSEDATGLAAILAPNEMGASLAAWQNLLSEWRGALGASGEAPVPDNLLGEAFVFYAIADRASFSPNDAGNDDEAIQRAVEEVAQHLPGGGGELRYRTDEDFWLWEGEEVDERRCLAALALAAPVTSDAAVKEPDERLSRWAWVDPERGLSGFAKYLLNAAKVRNYQRVLLNELPDIRSQRGQVEEALGDVLELYAEGGGAIDPDELRHRYERVSKARARSAEARLSLTYLQQLGETVAIARDNLELFTPAPHPEWQGEGTTIFTSDAELATWSTRQISRELAYGEAVLERSREAHELTTLSLEQSAEQQARRQAQVTLLQTSVVGALLGLLTAVQAFGLQVPGLNEEAEWPLAAFVGALALAVPPLIVHWHERYSPGDYAVAAAAGAVGMWFAVQQFSSSSPTALKLLLAAVGLGIGILVPLIVDILGGRVALKGVVETAERQR
jgi:hypothetical protein